MLERVVEEEPELVSKKEQNRARGVEREIGRMGLGRGAEQAGQKRGCAVADP